MRDELHPLSRLAVRGEACGPDDVLRSARSAAHRRRSAPVLLASACAVLIAGIGALLLVNDNRGSSEVRTADRAPTATEVRPTTGPTDSRPYDVGSGCEAPEPSLQRDEVDVVVEVFLFCSEGIAPVELLSVDRVVPSDGEPLRAAMTQLLLGLTPAEHAGGLNSAFSSYTAGTLRGVSIDAGVATLDLTSGFVATNNFSTSNLSGVVLDQIQATVFQFPEIDAIEIEIEGERWCGWETTCDGASDPLITRG